MENRMYRILAENIRYARLRKELSQEELAEKASVSTGYIQVESGRTRVGLSSLLRIKEVLDIPANELFGEGEYGIFNQQKMKEIFFIIEKASKKKQIILLDTIRSLDASLDKIQIK